MSKEKLIYCNSGSEFEPVFEIGVDDTGVQCLVPVMVGDKQKMRNLQEEIQSYKEETDIKSIITRALNGDASALGSIGDFSDEIIDTTLFNKSVNEMHQINLQTEATLKASYNQFAGHDKISYNDYVSALKAGDFEKLSALTKEDSTDANITQ